MRNVRIVLVEPSHPGNIGGAARAMKNMGLNQLWLVNPKRYPDPQADWRAAGALDVLDTTHVVADVASAIAGCHWVVGTSTRSRRIPWPTASPKQIAQQIVSQPAQSNIAILFGREDNGLTNEELQRCHYHLQIPAAAQYPSLNLAMAVQVVCYEIYQASLKDDPVPAWDRKMATAEQLEGMLDHLQQVLIEIDFLDVDNPGKLMTRLRRLFVRQQLDDTEIQILRGIFKHFGIAGKTIGSESNPPPPSPPPP